jgi:hypothetical protein
MPHFSFNVVVTVVKFGEQPVIMTKRTLDVYMSIVTDVAYHMARSYLNRGWRIQKIELLDFDFHGDLANDWTYPD